MSIPTPRPMILSSFRSENETNVVPVDLGPRPIRHPARYPSPIKNRTNQASSSPTFVSVSSSSRSGYAPPPHPPHSQPYLLSPPCRLPPPVPHPHPLRVSAISLHPLGNHLREGRPTGKDAIQSARPLTRSASPP